MVQIERLQIKNTLMTIAFAYSVATEHYPYTAILLEKTQAHAKIISSVGLTYGWRRMRFLINENYD